MAYWLIFHDTFYYSLIGEGDGGWLQYKMNQRW